MVPPNFIIKGGFQGLTANFLYKKASAFAKDKKNVAFESIIGLLIYGLVLFPNFDNFVDVNAIKIFLSKNPVPTLLADTYHSIHYITIKKDGTILCCAPLLYKWFYFAFTPIRLFQSKHMKIPLVSKNHAPYPRRRCLVPRSR